MEKNGGARNPSALSNRSAHFVAKDPMDFDLSDALDDQNDRHPGGGPPKGNPGGGTLIILLLCWSR